MFKFVCECGYWIRISEYHYSKSQAMKFDKCKICKKRMRNIKDEE